MKTCLRSKSSARDACEGRSSDEKKTLWTTKVSKEVRIEPVRCKVCGKVIEFSSPEMGGPRAN